MGLKIVKFTIILYVTVVVPIVKHDKQTRRQDMRNRVARLQHKNHLLLYCKVWLRWIPRDGIILHSIYFPRSKCKAKLYFFQKISIYCTLLSKLLKIITPMTLLTRKIQQCRLALLSIEVKNILIFQHVYNLGYYPDLVRHQNGKSEPNSDGHQINLQVTTPTIHVSSNSDLSAKLPDSRIFVIKGWIFCTGTVHYIYVPSIWL